MPAKHTWRSALTRDHLPYGLYGGHPGTPSTNWLYAATDEQNEHGVLLPTMISTSIKAGERIYHKQAGAGGWGNPLRRPPEAVAHDVKNGKVSLESARHHYGVVVDPLTFAVDEAATATLREQMANQ